MCLGQDDILYRCAESITSRKGGTYVVINLIIHGNLPAHLANCLINDNLHSIRYLMLHHKVANFHMQRS
jgi:hypothetical protein